ncbi:hypothetical protein [Actinacidiphila glaucinigra]|uniref:hypothetical protein n=1 Tax=Actinacidiphila glaucinigra TaxID=235986 RepID=UPI0029B2BA7A|nr:hypothetical protein [Streptomyces sp. PA03-3a]
MPWWLWLIFWAQLAFVAWNMIRPTVHVTLALLGPMFFTAALKWHQSRRIGR